MGSIGVKTGIVMSRKVILELVSAILKDKEFGLDVVAHARNPS